ncbi:hypothetical protein [Salinisphaera sp. G21_0]|uniref:hypothetical protein n=1 Tax=Salinisphaera sp. G21_0 TaxID=2821094 RepID=UPI001ADB1D98|nr:hypothetical protein [Salinisphaera sp. G21_0]MBO9481955.1 hypothetical protein [Salinisphaera sp. G21_0]
MHSLITYFQLPADSDQFLSVQDVTISESGASGQAFSRAVEEADSTLCPMCTGEMTKNHLQQLTLPFNNPFNDYRFKKRSVVIVFSNTIKDQPLHLTVRTEALNDKPAPKYIPDNERFSIQSILGLSPLALQSSSVVDNNLHPTEKMYNLESADAFFESAAPVAIINPQPESVQNQQPKSPAEIECATEHSFHANEYQAQASAESEMDSSDNLAGSSGKKSDESHSLPIGRKSNRYKNDPAYAQKIRDRERERQRKLRNNPAFLKRERERLREIRKNPTYAERERQRQRERYQNDPDFAERQRKYQKERYHNNPDYAARQKEYCRKRRREQRMKQAIIAEEKTIPSANLPGNSGEL